MRPGYLHELSNDTTNSCNYEHIFNRRNTGDISAGFYYNSTLTGVWLNIGLLVHVIDPMRYKGITNPNDGGRYTCETLL